MEKKFIEDRKSIRAELETFAKKTAEKLSNFRVKIYSYVFEKMRAQESFTIQDLKSVESIWKYMVSPLANAFTVLLWSTLNYLISRILYIIRTPRI